MVDSRNYETLPLLDAGALLALTEALITAAPSAGSAMMRKTLGKVQEHSAALSAVWKPGKSTVGAARRDADNALDRAWGAVHRRLTAFEGLLPNADYAQPGRADADAMVAQLFPDGLTFTNIKYEVQWAESQHRVEWLTESNQWDALTRLAGQEFVLGLQATHATYGEVLGITTPADAPDETRVHVLIATLRESVRRYIDKLFGMLDEDDPASVALIETALQPIDDARARVAQRRGGGGGGGSDDGGGAGGGDDGGSDDPPDEPPPSE